jgi:hypothetical protein
MSRIVIVGLTNLPPSMSRLSTQCGIINISQPYRPSRPVTGIALLTFYIYVETHSKSTENKTGTHRKHAAMGVRERTNEVPVPQFGKLGS